MDTPLNEPDAAFEPPPLSPRLAALVVAGVVAVVAGYLAIGSVIGIGPLFGGFMFIFYLTAVMKAELNEFVPSLIGAMAGVGVAWLLHWGQDQLGGAGAVLAIVLILAGLMAAVLQRFPMLVNNSLWLFLTVGTIPAVQDHTSFGMLAVAVAYGAAYIGVLLVAASLVSRAKAKSADAVPVPDSGAPVPVTAPALAPVTAPVDAALPTA